MTQQAESETCGVLVPSRNDQPGLLAHFQKPCGLAIRKVGPGEWEHADGEGHGAGASWTLWGQWTPPQPSP